MVCYLYSYNLKNIPTFILLCLCPFKVNEDWRNCIQDAESRQLFINNFSIIDK